MGREMQRAAAKTPAACIYGLGVEFPENENDDNVPETRGDAMAVNSYGEAIEVKPFPDGYAGDRMINDWRSRLRG
jgi:hypothetical protein